MAENPGLSQRRQRAVPHRSFTLPSNLKDVKKEQGTVDHPLSDTIEILYNHPSVRIIHFTASVPSPSAKSSAEDSPVGVLPWRSTREQTIVVGAVGFPSKLALLTVPQAPSAYTASATQRLSSIPARLYMQFCRNQNAGAWMA